ncbi:MAG: hypothetical protein JW782_01650 [Candidatus Saganbacteria bacterium]|nr:hypothetical protein [Candidatus Saganbacteria bacterium]
MCVSASASYISLSTSMNSKVRDGKLNVLVNVVNKGDESAYNVQAEIRVGDKKVMAAKRQELGINQRYTVAETFDLDLKKPGQYPLILVMHYTDANQYPFSALTCNTFVLGAGSSPAEIFGRMEQATFWKEGEAKLTLRNISDAVISGSTQLVVPRELSVKRSPQPVKLSAKADRMLKFPVENFSALSGSNYQVFAITEYDLNNEHQTNITPGMLRIVETRTILGLSYTLVAALLAVLVVVFILWQFGLPFLKK